MKRKIRSIVLFIMAFMALPLDVSADEGAAGKMDWKPVMEAIIQVESGGNANARSGQCCGVLQISPILVRECNDILRRKKEKKRFKLSDRFNIQKSKEMFLIIQSFHNPQNSVEKAIRLWNGGIRYSVKATQRYYEKVMKYLR
ncbi:MAG: lytic transglycosylase domain-containing protein [Prevotella sp.]|uniref:lytic transglycosylase domain-containing protein n=1 Tax=Prevotella heparinolytica TaxID=28113 RepID=UPI002A979B2E|nr:lytic transglycosylase domain-containing protein [Prevotella sp.]